MAKKKIGKKSTGSSGKETVQIPMAHLIQGLEATIKMQSAILKVLESMPQKMKKAKLPAQIKWFRASQDPTIAVGEHCECNGEGD